MKKFKVVIIGAGDLFFNLGDKAGPHDAVNAALRCNKDGLFLYDAKDIIDVKLVDDICDKHKISKVSSPFGNGLICSKCYNDNLSKFKKAVVV